MSKRTLLIIVGVIVSLLLAIIATAASRGSLAPDGKLNLTIIPKDTKVVIDKRTRASGITSLAPGKHTIVLSRPSFTTRTVEVTIETNKINNQTFFLSAINTAAGQAWEAANPEEATEGEGLAGQQIEENGAKLAAKYPILRQLPYQGNNFTVDFGLSVKNPSDPNSIALYINAAPDAKERANNWIKAQGYNLSDFEIIYDIPPTEDQS